MELNEGKSDGVNLKKKSGSDWIYSRKVKRSVCTTFNARRASRSAMTHEMLISLAPEITDALVTFSTEFITEIDIL